MGSNSLHNGQDTRSLVVISNFGHLSKVIIPSMLTQLETALGTSVVDDRQVKKKVLYTHLRHLILVLKGVGNSYTRT